MIIRLIIVLIFQFGVSQAFTQKLSYTDIRRTCLARPVNTDDTITLLKNIYYLETLDTLQIRKNALKDYYAVLGKTYWLLAHGKNKIFFQQKAFTAYNKVLSYKPNDWRPLWYFALWYAYHDDCEKARSFMAAYKNHSNEKKWNTECIAFAEAQCQ